jgi:DNA-binding NarL/FixJ family response regulator
VIRVLIVDDHASAREPLAIMLGLEPDIEIVGQAGSVSEATAASAEADLAIVDLGLPDGSGIGFIEQFRVRFPEAVVLVLTGETDLGVWANALESGAAGVIPKAAPFNEVLAAVRSAAAGEMVHSPAEITEMLRLAARHRIEDRQAERIISSLTPREIEVLQALALGLSDKDIAGRLSVSPKTVRVHMANILEKLDRSSRLQALIFAVQHDIVSLTESK